MRPVPEVSSRREPNQYRQDVALDTDLGGGVGQGAGLSRSWSVDGLQVLRHRAWTGGMGQARHNQAQLHGPDVRPRPEEKTDSTERYGVPQGQRDLARQEQLSAPRSLRPGAGLASPGDRRCEDQRVTWTRPLRHPKARWARLPASDGIVPPGVPPGTLRRQVPGIRRGARAGAERIVRWCQQLVGAVWRRQYRVKLADDRWPHARRSDSGAVIADRRADVPGHRHSERNSVPRVSSWAASVRWSAQRGGPGQARG